MSEKHVWKWLNKTMDEYPEWGSSRLEGCCEKGIPDSVVTLNFSGKRYTTFVEIKDWDSPKIHPLSIEQKNFLGEFGGVVLIKLPRKRVAVLLARRKDLSPLLSCDVGWAVEEADLVLGTEGAISGFHRNLLASVLSMGSN